MPTSVAPLWPSREDGALPDIDDPSLRIRSSRPKTLWAIVGIIVALAGVAAIAIALTSRGDETRATLGSMEIISLPPGATVSIDGRAAGTTPLTLDALPVGKTVRLRLEMNRHDVWEREEKVASAARFKVIAQLKEIRGTLRVVSRPAGAEVFLNNQSIGVTPLERTDLDPFTDGVLELRKQGHKPRRVPLTWAGKRSLDLPVELDGAGGSRSMRKSWSSGSRPCP
jgi:hypothetical protein